jgi:hypothetical protein
VYGKNGGKLFQDKIQAFEHITYMFMLQSILNLKYNLNVKTIKITLLWL